VEPADGRSIPRRFPRTGEAIDIDGYLVKARREEPMRTAARCRLAAQARQARARDVTTPEQYQSGFWPASRVKSPPDCMWQLGQTQPLATIRDAGRTFETEGLLCLAI
jgi:hypothetical protein